MREERGEAGVPCGLLDVCAQRGEVCLVEIDDEQQRLRREQLEASQALEVVSGQLQRAQRPALLERRLAPLDQVALLLELGRARFLQILRDTLEPSLEHAEIRED